MPPEQRRADLIEIALELFGERPPEAVAVDDITARAQVSRPLFYRYFAGIGELRIAALRTVTEELLDALAEQPAGSPDERLRHAVRALIDVADRYRAGYIALLRDGSASGSAETDAAVEEVRRRALALLLDVLAEADPGPSLLLTLRCWIAVVESTVLDWLRGQALPRGELDDWLVAQLSAMLAATATHRAGPLTS